MTLRITTITASAVLALGLSACNGLPGTGGGHSFDINAFLNSTTCAHDDEVQGVTGAAGIPASLQFKAARHCPAAVPAGITVTPANVAAAKAAAESQALTPPPS